MEISLIIALVGIVGFIGFLIWLIVRAVNWDSKWPAVLGMVLFAAVFVVGAYLFIADDSDTGRQSASNASSKSDNSGKSGGLEAERGLFNVTITVPADFIGEEMTQEQLDQTVKEEKELKSATLNDDGSVTYVMSKSQHKKMMDDIRESIDQGIAEMVGDEDYPNFVSIEPNKDYTKFVVTIKSKEVGIVESFSALAFYMYGGMYNAFNGTPVDNVCVQFVNEITGEVIEEANSKDMGEINDSSNGSNSSESDPTRKKMVGSGDLGDFHVEIKGAELTKGQDGDTYIVITYSWTNNSDKTTHAGTVFTTKAFQNGIQIDGIYLIGDDKFDSSAESRDVKPGATLDVQCAFALTSNTATVEFELTEWISFSDDMVTMDFEPGEL